MVQRFDWYGYLEDSPIMNLKAMCYDLNCRYSERERGGKTLYILDGLTTEQSMKLVSTVKKYDLIVFYDNPGKALPAPIKINYEALHEA